MSDESDPKDLPGVSKGKVPEGTSSPAPSETAPTETAPSETEDDRMRALIKRAVRPSKSDPPAAAAVPPVLDEEAFDEGMLDEVDLKDALRGALRPAPGAVAPSLLKGVQRKLRMRSRGKFYGDGWSTSESPKTTYLVTSLIMLVLVVLVFFALVPWSSNTLP